MRLQSLRDSLGNYLWRFRFVGHCLEPAESILVSLPVLSNIVAISMNSGRAFAVKTCLAAVFFSCLTLAVTNPARAADPADYPLSLHISASTYGSPANPLFELVTATVGGKHYQLQGPTSSAKIFTHGNGLINPGDYRAKLSMDEHKTSYESLQQFEILFPDGTTRKFTVIGQWE